MGRFLMVCLAGGAGSGARYLLGGWAVRTFGPGFPWGTLIVNVLGSFLMVIVMYLGTEKALISPDLRVVLTAGVMGGFTTYSSFNFESLRLIQQGMLGLAAMYIFATLFGCLAAGVGGLLLARALA